MKRRRFLARIALAPERSIMGWMQLLVLMLGSMAVADLSTLVSDAVRSVIPIGAGLRYS
jgi:hypothetical protein